MEDYLELEELEAEGMAEGELCRVFGLPVTVFAVFIAAGALTALLLALYRTKKTRITGNAVLWFALLALPLGVFFARLVYCLSNFGALQDAGIGWIFRPDDGGFTLVGACAGVLLAGFLAARITGESFLGLMDTVLPGLLILLAFERFGEGATENGTGLDVETAALQFYPLARPGLYEGEYTYAVNLFAALTALIAGVYTQAMDAPRGRAAGTAVIITACGQIVWESIRRDERMMFMMASFLLIFCGIVLFAVLLLSLHGTGWPAAGKILAALGFLLLAAAVTAFQFFMEGKIVSSIPAGVCFALSALCTVLLGALCLRVLKDGTAR